MTLDPRGYDATQVPDVIPASRAQDIPAGVLRMLPAPLPVSATVSEADVPLNSA
jgi:hypothetical protein